LEKDSVFLSDSEPFVCNFFPVGTNNGSTLLFIQLGFSMHMPFVTTLWECDMTTIKFNLIPACTNKTAASFFS